jgi:PST family polysaccharide transporter
MSGFGRILRNAANLATAEVAARLAGLATTLILARLLHPAGYGQFAVATAFAMVVGALAGGGLQPLTIREIARNGRSAAGIFWTAFWLRTILQLGMLIAVVVALHFINFDPSTRLAAALLSVAILCDGSTTQALAYYRGQQRMSVESKFMSTARLLGVGVIFIAVAVAPTVVQVAYAAVINSGTMMVISTVMVMRELKPVRPRRRAMRVFLWESFPFAAGALLMYIFFRLDTLLLRFLGVTSASIGEYSAAYRLMEVSRVPSLLVGEGYGPAAARFKKLPDKDGLIDLASRAWTLTVVLALPAVLIYALAPGLIVHIVFGEAFRSAAPYLVVMAVMPVFMAVDAIAIQTVNSQGQQAWTTGIFGICAVVNLTANLILIPKMGAMGAAVAMVVTEIVQCVSLLTWIVVRLGRPRPTLVWSIGGALVALGGAFMLPTKFLIVRVGIALLTYAIIAAPTLLRLRRPLPA